MAEVGVSVDKMAALSIDAMIGTIQAESVIKATSRFLLAAKKATASLARFRIRNPTKIFLSAFMIVHHPEEMMPEMNDDHKVGVLLHATSYLIISLQFNS